MKRRFLFLVCGLLLDYVAMSQTNWCPAGADWHYRYISLGEEGYIHYHYTNDTIFANRTCHKIESTVYSDLHDPPGFHHYDTGQATNIYTYNADDTVYFYYGMSEKWLPTYFFNAQTGDTLVVPNYAMHTNSDSTVNILVDSTGIMQIDTYYLRWYDYHVVDTFNWCNFPGRAVEKLGMMNNDLIPFWHCITDDYYYNFCSYQDSITTLYPSNVVCQFIINNIPQLNNQESILSIQPNPASNSVIVSVNERIIGCIATITDVTGRKVTREQLLTQESALNVSNLLNGIYLLSVTDEDGSSTTRKLVIRR